ncbi:MAG: hypothetical protein ACI8QD_000929 [Cyclobacteriaceae bacterium]|jgi:hypothetical protein
MKKVLAIAFLVFIGCTINEASAQDKFTFRYTMQELNKIQMQSNLKSHWMGDEIAKKFTLLKESFTSIEMNAVAQTESTVVEKPSIYYSCKKVSKYLKKSVKKGLISEDEAFDQLANVLNIALNIRYQETAQIEEILWDINKNPSQVIAFYKEKIELEM